MDNAENPAGKANTLAVHDTPDNLALMGARLKDSGRFERPRQPRP